MIRQIKKSELPAAVTEKISRPETAVYIKISPEDRVKTKQSPGSETVTYVKCPFVRTSKDSLYLALTKEKSPAGSLVTKALWYGKSVTALCTDGETYEEFTLYPDRSWISGGIFEKMLHDYRINDASHDFAAVWEMSFESSTALDGRPEGLYTRDTIDFFEMHYDNPALKA